MLLKNFIQLYDDWNRYICINDNNLKLYDRVKIFKLESNKNYERILNTRVITFGFYPIPGNLNMN